MVESAQICQPGACATPWRLAVCKLAKQVWSGPSVASYPLLLAWFPRSGLSLTGLKLTRAVEARPLLALQGGALVVAGSLHRGPSPAGQGLPARSVVGLRGWLHCHRGVYLGVRTLQACGLVRYSTHGERLAQVQSWCWLVQAQLHVGRYHPSGGRAALATEDTRSGSCQV